MIIPDSTVHVCKRSCWRIMSAKDRLSSKLLSLASSSSTRVGREEVLSPKSLKLPESNAPSILSVTEEAVRRRRRIGMTAGSNPPHTTRGRSSSSIVSAVIVSDLVVVLLTPSNPAGEAALHSDLSNEDPCDCNGKVAIFFDK